MKSIITAMLISFFIMGCDSPIQNKVRDGAPAKKGDLKTASFQQTGLDVKVQWLAGPFGNINRNSHLIVYLYRNGELYSLPKDLSLDFYASMPSMGHPLEDAGFFQEIDPGIYINKGIRYNMPGDWKNELWIMDADFNIRDRLQWHIFFQ